MLSAAAVLRLQLSCCSPAVAAQLLQPCGCSLAAAALLLRLSYRSPAAAALLLCTPTTTLQTCPRGMSLACCRHWAERALSEPRLSRPCRRLSVLARRQRAGRLSFC